MLMAPCQKAAERRGRTGLETKQVAETRVVSWLLGVWT